MIKFLSCFKTQKKFVPDSIKNVFCPKPWNQVCTLINGQYRACCDMQGKTWGILRDDSGAILNARVQSVQSALDAPLNRDLRKTMLRGERHPMCAPCWDREDAGMLSSRQQLNKSFPHIAHKAYSAKIQDQKEFPLHQFPIEFVDLRLGNSCNLKCKICGPSESSLWVNDWVELQDDHEVEKKIVYYGQDLKVQKQGGRWSLIDEKFDWHENSQMLKELVSENQYLRRLYFTGGEPLINKTHWDLLQQLKKRGASRNIDLQYNSNILSIPSQAKEIWPYFNSVHVSCSVDGVGSYAEYLRPPTRWERLHRSILELDQFPSYLSASWNPTVTLINIIHLPEMSRWILREKLQKIDPRIWINILTNPSYLSCQILPLPSKIRVEQHYEKILRGIEYEFGVERAKSLHKHFAPVLQHMFAKERSNEIELFRQRNKKLDLLQGIYLEKSLPEVADLIF